MNGELPNKEDARNAIETLVRYIEKIDGPLREGLLDTPKRVIEAFEELYQGYTIDADQLLDATFNAEGYDGIVLLRDIEFHSTCEHHMLPFFGRCHIGYIPDGKVLGVSKLARISDMFSRRLQIQEKLTHEIATAVFDMVKPLGVGVIIEARHLCMMMRGVQKQNSVTTTSAFTGIFEEDKTRVEFIKLITSKLS